MLEAAATTPWTAVGALFTLPPRFFLENFMINMVLLQTAVTAATPLCAVSIWLLLVGLLWAVWEACRDGVQRLKRLHQIPCHRCAYFTGDYRLKCAVHPCKALTEDAIACTDFEAARRETRCEDRSTLLPRKLRRRLEKRRQ